MSLAPNRSGEIEVFVGDREYLAVLHIGELEKLEEVLDLGSPNILNAFLGGNWRIKHVIEVIRWGLIGGGLTHKDAAEVVNRWITSGHLFTYAEIALKIIEAAIYGAREDEPDLGEPMAETESPPDPPTPEG